MNLWGHRFSQNANQKLQEFLLCPLINFQGRNPCNFWLAFLEKRRPHNLTDFSQNTLHKLPFYLIQMRKKLNPIDTFLECCSHSHRRKWKMELQRCTAALSPNWHEGWYFYLLVLFGSDFVCWIFIKNFQTLLEVKIDINRVNLKPCQAHWVL